MLNTGRENDGSAKPLNLQTTRKLGKVTEFLILLTLIVVAWGLLSLPIAFYYISPSQLAINRNNTVVLGDNGTRIYDGSGEEDGDDAIVCYNDYTGTQCLSGLKQYTSCETSFSDGVYISNTIQNQAELEETMGRLLFVLDSFINPTKELCGSGGDDYRPTVGQCIEIRDSICKEEWEQAIILLASNPALPQLDCSTLPTDGLECSQETNCTVIVNTSGNECTEIKCHKHFYCENGFCKPRCDRFSSFPESFTRLSRGLMATFGCIGFICGIGVIITFILRHKTILHFPIVLILYATISQLLGEVTLIITLIDRPAFFCSSIDLLESLDHPTPYCTFSGVVQSYIFLQTTLFWILHIAAIYWKVQFPFHSHYYDETKKTRYVHIGFIIVALFVPLIPPIVIGTTGRFTLTRFPPIACVGREIDASFYTLVLPISLLYAAGATLLLLILWKIRRHMASRDSQSTNLVVVEFKLFVVFLYYLLSGALQLTNFSIAARHSNHDIDAVFQYFICQRSGDDPMCSLGLRASPLWTLFSVLILLLIPAPNLFFALKLGDLKKRFVLCTRYHKKN